MFRAFVLLACAIFAQAQTAKPVTPAGVKPVGPYTPGLLTGNLLYVSGQGARDAKGQLPATFEAQVRQCMDNVQDIVKAAGLSMEHIVFAQVYLSDIKQYETMNKVYAQYFKKDLPARTTIGVSRMPTGTPVEIAAVAVTDLKQKKVLQNPGVQMPVPVSAGVQVGNRVFLTGGLGRDIKTGQIPKDPRRQVKLIMDSAEAVLKTAQLELRHILYANIYVTPKMPMKALAEAIDEYLPDETVYTVVQTAALPFGVDLQIGAVASRDLRRLGHCTGIGQTAYCAGRAGTIRQALDAVKADLEANKMSLDDVVAVNVYMDDIDQFAAMNKIYADYFPKSKPTRTTVQPWKGIPEELAIPPSTGASSKPDDSPKVLVSVVVSK